MNKKSHSVFILLFLLVISRLDTQSATITHNIANGSLTIAGNSSDDYIITGTTTSNYVLIQAGYCGIVTLQNLNIMLSGNNSPIAVKGQNNCSNRSPISNIDIILEGNNVLCYAGNSGCAAFQVEQGTQINIAAVNPSDNSSGTLTATVTSSEGGAGIGALNRESNKNEATDSAILSGGIIQCGIGVPTAGGNIVISSGTITAQGGHGAGIGGGYASYYDGMIVIYGGIVHASALRHAAGIGSGCPTGRGVIPDCFTPNSAIIVLPPAQISAIGADTGTARTDLGLAGANNIIYIGDTAKPLVTVQTEDLEPYANIYVDLSQNPIIAYILGLIVPSLDIYKIKFGQTDSSGHYHFNGILNDSTTFFTDATSSNTLTFGRPYFPETMELPSGGTVILKLMDMKLSIEPFPSVPLREGYSFAEAFSHAFRIKIIYGDSLPMSNIVFDIAGDSASDFSAADVTFFAPDSITLISPPTSLHFCDTVYVVIPLDTGKTVGDYADVFRFVGTWAGYSTGYIRQIVGQSVYYIDTVYQSICSDETYFFAGKNRNKAGLYADTLSIDSLVYLELTVFPLYDDTIYANICLGERYNEHGFDTLPTEAGFIHCCQHFVSTAGCDSIITLHLTVYPIYYDTIDANICLGERYDEYNFDTIPIAAGFVQCMQYHVTETGYDSIITLNLTVYSSYNQEDTQWICPHELPYLYGDSLFINEGTKNIYFKTIHDCDSVIVLTLILNQTYNQADTQIICANELPYTYGDSLFTSGGVKTVHFTTAENCDSIVVLTLILNPAYNQTDTQTICANELPYTYGDSLFTKGGVKTILFKTADHCDSMVLLTLIVHAEDTYREQITTCDSSYTWRGTTYEKSGVYSQPYRNQYGCDSTHILELEVKQVELEIVSSVADFCQTQQTVLVATTNAPSVLWNTGDETKSLIVHKYGDYIATAIDGVCKKSDTLHIEKCKYKLFLPNAITPSNQDGLNDYFSLSLSNPPIVTEAHIAIYDRWGQRIFHSNDIFFKWDGTVNGTLITNATYSYILTVRFLDGEEWGEWGSVVVL